MSFDREKRILVASLAALAPIPLPFNDVIGWPALILFWLGVGLFGWRTSEGRLTPIPNWLMNILGLAYLPVFLLEFSLFWQGRLIRPLVHLALFSLAVKLFGMRRERDKWHVFLLTFFLCLASMGTSVHPAVVVFLIVFLSLSVLVLARFASYHVLSSYGAATRPRQAISFRSFVITSTVLTLLGAIPLFVLLPRLGGPYVVGPGGSTRGGPGRTGMSDTITLDVVGRVRTSREVVMRVAYETPPPDRHEMRFRSGVYSQFLGDGWALGRRRSEHLSRSRDGFFRIGEGQSRSWASIWLEPLTDRTLVVPIETVALDLRSRGLQLDSSGVLSLHTDPGGTLNYRVGMASESRLLVHGADLRSEVLEAEMYGITKPIADLARQVGVGSTVKEQAASIEAYLGSRYSYTLDLVGSRVDNPVESFLFDWRRGHCEYFASSMVLMLRAIGVRARLVTGYLGGEYNPFEGYYVLRQSDAHAWVEALSTEEGWLVFDPTPTDGRPQARSAGLRHMLAQAYDYMIFRWDRYVLTYGFFDQVGIARKFLLYWKSWLDSFRSEGGDSPTVDGTRPEQKAEVEPVVDDATEFEFNGFELLPFLLLIGASAWWIWRHRPAFSAVRAYRKLRHGIERSEVIPISAAVPPLRLAAQIERHRPAASEPARRVIDLYLRESFGGQPLSEQELMDLRSDVRDALQNLRKTA